MNLPILPMDNLHNDDSENESFNISTKMAECIQLVEPVLLELVFWYNTERLKLIHMVDSIYQFDPLTKTIMDWGIVIWTFFKYIYFRATHYRVEPKGQWLSLVGLLEYPGEANPNYTYNFVENFERDELNELRLDDYMDKFYSRAQKTIIQNPKHKEILLILKESDEKYFVRTCINPVAEYRALITPPKYSHVELFCIEYKHPKMTSPISLSIPKSYLWVGNELLSMAFVRRLLEYEPLFVSYYFDEDYVINIIDQNIQQHTLTRLNYIVLEEDSLVVITLPEKITIPDVIYSEKCNSDDEDVLEDDDQDDDEDVIEDVIEDVLEEPYEPSVEQPGDDEYESDWDTPIPIFEE